MYYIAIFSTIFFGYFLHPYVKNNCKKLNTFKNMAYTLTSHKNVCGLIKDGIIIILKLLWLRILQKINNSVVKIDKNTYMVQFTIKGKSYKQILRTRSGPSPIVQIIDENEEDVTNDIEPYFNTFSAFDNELSVKYFEYKTLTFNMDDGDSKILTTDEKLSSIET